MGSIIKVCSLFFSKAGARRVTRSGSDPPAKSAWPSRWRRQLANAAAVERDAAGHVVPFKIFQQLQSHEGKIAGMAKIRSSRLRQTVSVQPSLAKG